jgi:hypothetical protein
MLDGLLVVTFAVSSRQSSMADVKMRWAATTNRNLIRPLSKVQPVVAVGPVVGAPKPDWGRACDPIG